MTDVIEEPLRRQQALQLERLRLALRKASRSGELEPAAEQAWGELGVPSASVPVVRELLYGIAVAALREMKGRVPPPGSLDAVGTVRDSLSDAPSAALPTAARRLLQVTFDRSTAGTICALGDAGLRAVPPDDLPAVRLLAKDDASPADVAVLQSDRGPEWRLFADVALLRLGRAPVDLSRLMTLWDSKCIFDPTQSIFHSQIAYYRAYDLTRERKFDVAWRQAEEFGELAVYTTTPIEKEIINLRAYLLLAMHGDASLELAIRTLRQIDRSPIARKNLALVLDREGCTLNERGPIENPYLALGANHGASRTEWHRAWLRLRSAKRHDVNGLSDANRARDQIVALERDGSDGAGRVFITPLSKEFALQPTSGSLSTGTGDTLRTPIFQGDEQVSEVVRKLHSAALHELLTALDS